MGRKASREQKESETSCPDFRFRRLRAVQVAPERDPLSPWGSVTRAPQTWFPGTAFVPLWPATPGGGTGKVSDSRRPMAGAGGPLRLREWLVAQIEERALCGAALGGRRQDPLPHPSPGSTQPSRVTRCGRTNALQVREWGRGVPSLVPGGLCMHAVPAPGAT